MVDWMIEVLSSYKMSEESFFKSVQFMDCYLKHENQKQETKDVHLIGVTSMFTAAKYEEIHPMRLSLMVEKIARRKFTREEILHKESRMINCLNFRLEEATLYDMVKHINRTLIINSDEINLKLRPSFETYFGKILLYLTKMCLFSHELVEKETKLLAGAVFFIALKTLEQVNKDFCPEDVLPTISQLLYIPEDRLIGVGREVLELAKNFGKLYPNLNNLKKFNKFDYKQ